MYKEEINGMDNINITILLDFLYNKYAVTFLMCLIGALVGTIARQIKTKKLKILSLGKAFIYAGFLSLILCCIADLVKGITFSIYAVICVFAGIWEEPIVSRILNNEFISHLVNNIIKIFSKDEDSTLGKIIKAIYITNDEVNKKSPSEKNKTKSDSETSNEKKQKSENKFKLDEEEDSFKLEK